MNSIECQQLREITEQLVDSFQRVGGINHIEGANLPSKRAIADITESLLHLLFPGYYDDDPIKNKNFFDALCHQISVVRNSLGTELQKAGLVQGTATRPIQPSHADELVCLFLKKLPAIRKILSTDVESAFEGDPAATCFEEIILAYPGLEAIAVHRLAHELHRASVALIPRMMSEWAHSRTGIDIHPGAQIGSHFFVDHGTGTVIGETCEIGDHVKIYHGVTLGARSTSGGQKLRNIKRHPTIESHVTIYPGATILGGETVIGFGTTIGGNVSLMHSIAPHSLVTYEERSLVVIEKIKEVL